MRDPFANYDSWLERPYQDQFNGPECECECDDCMEGICENCEESCQLECEGDYDPDDYDLDDDILDWWEEDRDEG